MGDYFALAISVIGLLVAFAARQDSSRSANAAEKSALSAEKAAIETQKSVKIAQSIQLMDSFEKIDKVVSLLRILKMVRKEEYETLRTPCLEGIRILNTLLPYDKDLMRALVALRSIIIDRTLDECIGRGAKKELPNKIQQASTVFENKKLEYLNIG